MKLRYTPEAIRDLREAGRYISDVLNNPIAAAALSKTVLRQCATLKDFPEMGPSVGALTGCETDLRLLVCKNHVAIYRIEADTVSVVRVINARQDYLRVLFGDELSAQGENETDS